MDCSNVSHQWGGQHCKGPCKSSVRRPKNSGSSNKAPRKVTESVYSRSKGCEISWAFPPLLLMLSLRPLLCIPSRHPLLFTWVLALSYAWLPACECVIWHTESWERFCSVSFLRFMSIFNFIPRFECSKIYVMFTAQPSPMVFKLQRFVETLLGSFWFEVEDPVGEAQAGCTCACSLLTPHQWKCGICQLETISRIDLHHIASCKICMNIQCLCCLCR